VDQLVSRLTELENQLTSIEQGATALSGVGKALDTLGKKRARLKPQEAETEVALLRAVIQPETILRWPRAGFKSFGRWKSRNRAGRPKIDRGLRDLIQRMSKENPQWGALRIHDELLMLGFEMAQSTVSKYMVQGGSPSQSWKTFFRNHAQAIAAIDLCVVPTLTFERLFAFLVLSQGRRQLAWFEVTRHPTAEWLARQISEAFPWASAPAYDRAYMPSSHG
jgi:hypothetical protein